MNRIARALNWAAAILLVALGSAFGAIEPATASTLIAVFAVLAAIQTRGAGCLRRSAPQ
jgi:hypothetical protein